MSYNNTTGVYTPPVGATSATPGQLVQSAVWDSIFSDITTALTALGQAAGPASIQTPVTVTTGYSVAALVSDVICTGTVGVTVTLPVAASYPGRILNIKVIGTQPVISATANVVPVNTAAATTAILAGTAGKWARMKSDGTSWVIMAAN